MFKPTFLTYFESCSSRFAGWGLWLLMGTSPVHGEFHDLCFCLCPSKAALYVLLLSPGDVTGPGPLFTTIPYLGLPGAHPWERHSPGVLISQEKLSISPRVHRKTRLLVISVLVGECFFLPGHSFLKKNVFWWSKYYVSWFQPSIICRHRVLLLSSR